jgi:hypothetical protein
MYGWPWEFIGSSISVWTPKPYLPLDPYYNTVWYMRYDWTSNLARRIRLRITTQVSDCKMATTSQKILWNRKKKSEWYWHSFKMKENHEVFLTSATFKTPTVKFFYINLYLFIEACHYFPLKMIVFLKLKKARLFILFPWN